MKTRRERRSAVATTEERPIEVCMYYLGNRVDGLLYLGLECITITSGKLTGEVFTSPRSAGCAVIQLYSPNINPSVNGWKHWLIAATSSPIDTLR